MKCTACKEDFKKEELRSFSDNGKKYCPKCYKEEEYRRSLVNICFRLYNHKVDYKIVIVQIKMIHNMSGMSYFDIFYTLKYTQEILNLKFDEKLLMGLSRYYYSAMKYYGEIFELKKKKVFNNIKPKIIKNNKEFKPNKLIEPTDMSKI